MRSFDKVGSCSVLVRNANVVLLMNSFETSKFAIHGFPAEGVVGHLHDIGPLPPQLAKQKSSESSP